MSWADWAAGELVAEMEHQVRPDGTAHEASTSYHRLVTELFLRGTEAADALAPDRLPDWYRERLERMLGFVRDYTRPDGLAPQIGDADDGRFLPLGSLRRRSARPSPPLRAVRRPRRRALPTPDGGFYVLRSGELYAIVRCGDTGRHGRGGHGHNDQLSFELSLRDQPLVVDPGTYVYTATRRSETASGRRPFTARFASTASSRTSCETTTSS